MVDLRIGCIHCIIYCIFYHQFPGDKSSHSKPGEEFENGIMNVNGESSIMNKTYDIKYTT